MRHGIDSFVTASKAVVTCQKKVCPSFRAPLCVMLAAAVAEAERACYRGGAQSPDLHVRSAQVYALAR